MWSDEKAEKDAFAAAWIKEPDAWKASLLVFGPSNAGRALQASHVWVKDDYVLNKKAELIEEHGEEHYLPTKADTARKAMAVHDEARTAEDKLKALDLYARLMGYIAKAEPLGKLGNGIVAIPVNELDAKL
jgi:hypothetical protein